MDNEVKRFVAIDMGAESSRAILGTFSGGGLSLEELRRWPTRGTVIDDTAYWDFPFILAEIKAALRTYAEKFGPHLDGIGVDSWGVDFGLFDDSSVLLQNPVQYRDHRTDGLLEAAEGVIPRRELYERTGIAFLQLNTLYQLWALARSSPEVLRRTRRFLMMSDLVHHALCGVARGELTNASTTQLLDANSGEWRADIFKAFGLPVAIMPEIVRPGTVLGPIRDEIADETGLRGTSVIAPCTHDTGSAVLAVPSEGVDWAYISCGTWSLMGVERRAPITTLEAMRLNFTNERGYGGTYRFLKNIMGLWVLQEARRAWAKRGLDYSYEELIEMARETPPFALELDIDHSSFFNPDDMLDAIGQYCANTDQRMPDDPGAIARAVLEGVARRYATTLGELESLTGRPIYRVHMVGGGSRNTLLCQLAADAMGVPVIAGPAECTALGNLIAQAIAVGAVEDWSAGRRMVRETMDLKVYSPRL